MEAMDGVKHILNIMENERGHKRLDRVEKYRVELMCITVEVKSPDVQGVSKLEPPLQH